MHKGWSIGRRDLYNADTSRLDDGLTKYFRGSMPGSGLDMDNFRSSVTYPMKVERMSRLSTDILMPVGSLFHITQIRLKRQLMSVDGTPQPFF